MAFQLEIPGGIKRTNPGPVDVYYTPNGARRGYTSAGQACSLVPAGVRSDGLTVLVNSVEYWWLNGSYADTDLQRKQVVVTPGMTLEGALITRWEPNKYAADLVVVLYGSTLYELTADRLPFTSENFELELDFGQWTAICCDATGTGGSNEYLETESGRRIQTEAGESIEI